jgi:signal transduction histidine kinase
MKLPALNLNSIRLRFLVGGLVWVGFGLLAAGVLVSTLFRIEMTGQIKAELNDHLTELQQLVEFDGQGHLAMVRPLSDPRFLPYHSGYYWQVSLAGRPVMTSASLGGATITGALPEGTDRLGAGTGPTGVTFVNGVTLRGPGGRPVQYLVAGDRGLLEAMMYHFDRILALTLLAFAVLMVAGGAMLVLFGLRPLGRLRQSVAAIRTGAITRMPGGFPAEITPLVSDLNALLDATTDMAIRARTASANLAHALRTPLAVMTYEGEALAAAGFGAAADTILAQSRKMQHKIEYHLARARAMVPGRVPGVVCRMDERAATILSAMRRLHAGRPVHFNIASDTAAAVTIDCDPLDVGEMLSNLLDNAGKWARADVVIGWQLAAEGAVITIDDDGPGLAAADRDRVFAVGERLDESVPGSGLGLSIVRDLAGLYGGSIALQESPLGGLRARLVLPAAV